ncbi:MAG: NAD(P)/FAD-dependent oxidoreductase [Anaerolineae bacterium]|nr:NAD(P)/FAD-dependent oxidoreductase [Anaerolineae bacterium]
MRRYVIIGSGAAGLAAAETIRRKDASGTIILLTGDRHGYYSRPGLAYYLTGEVPEKQLFPYDRNHIRNLNLLWEQSAVVRVHPAEHQLYLEGAKRVDYDRLLIATGATAILPDTPGISLEGVVKLDNMEDARHILRLARRGATAVVVGGGITALELVEGLAARGMKVHYFLRGDRYWSNVLDEEESRLVENRLTHEGVVLHHHTNLIEILGRGGRVSAVQAQEGDRDLRLNCSLVAVAIGIRPRKNLAAQAGLENARGILCNEALQTSHPDIYTAGDVAEVIDPVSGKPVLDSLWGPAVQMGKVAGGNMAGANLIYRKEIPFNVTRIAGLITTIIGQVGSEPAKTPSENDLTGAIMRGDSEIWRQYPDAVVTQTVGGHNRLRLYVRQATLAGALVMGDQQLSGPIQRIVREKLDIRSIHNMLIAPNAPLSDIITQFWRERQPAHAAFGFV